jgi:hypothetical protein
MISVMRKTAVYVVVMAVMVWGNILPLSAQNSGVGGDSVTRLLWIGTDSRISLWKLDVFLNVISSHEYGPYAGWLPIAITVAMNNETYVLWRNTDGSISLWVLDPNLNFLQSKNYGPFPGWLAESLSPDTSGPSDLRLIWRNTNGSVGVWYLAPSGDVVRTANYGPFFGYAPGNAGDYSASSATAAEAAANAKAAAAMATDSWQ